MRKISLHVLSCLPLFAFACATSLPPKSLGLDSLHQPAPDLELVHFDGKSPLKLHDLQGRAIILHFWASWCEPCKKELPELWRRAREWGGPDFVFLPVQIDSSRNDAPFLTELGPKFPLWRAKDQNAAKKLWAWGVPMTYFISAAGIVEARATGAKDWDTLPEDEFRQFLRALQKR